MVCLSVHLYKNKRPRGSVAEYLLYFKFHRIYYNGSVTEYTFFILTLAYLLTYNIFKDTCFRVYIFRPLVLNYILWHFLYLPAYLPSYLPTVVKVVTIVTVATIVIVGTVETVVTKKTCSPKKKCVYKSKQNIIKKNLFPKMNIFSSSSFWWNKFLVKHINYKKKKNSIQELSCQSSLQSFPSVPNSFLSTLSVHNPYCHLTTLLLYSSMRVKQGPW